LYKADNLLRRWVCERPFSPTSSLLTQHVYSSWQLIFIAILFRVNCELEICAYYSNCVILIVLHVKASTRLCHTLQEEQFWYVPLFIEQSSNYVRQFGHLFQANALVSLSQAMESKWDESNLNVVRVNCQLLCVILVICFRLIKFVILVLVYYFWNRLFTQCKCEPDALTHTLFKTNSSRV